MHIRPVKTEKDYDAALDRIESLWGADPGTLDGERLEILLILVREYEKVRHPVPPPSPVGAIKFVMDQRGLTPNDLIPYLGSRSKVSEVLNGKRSLTLSMIRALNLGLNIPAEVLIQDGADLPEDGEDIDWASFPTKTIVSRGWVSGFDPNTQAEEIVRTLVSRVGLNSWSGEACLRQGTRRNAKDDLYSIHAWILGVLLQAKDMKTSGEFRKDEIDAVFLRKVAQCSVFSDGPIKAREYLASKGVKLVAVRHLKKTYLDGAVMLVEDSAPVIGLSLRYDRLDNFWFSLLHELAHLALGHVFGAGSNCIIDDLDLHASLDALEREADKVAQEALIPEELWMAHKARRTARIADIVDLARQADVHPAIVAGRVRFEKGNYRLLAKHIGHGEVRRLFGVS